MLVAAVIGMVVVPPWLFGESGVLVIPNVTPKREAAPTIDWSKVEALDDSAAGILSGESKRKAEEEALGVTRALPAPAEEAPAKRAPGPTRAATVKLHKVQDIDEYPDIVSIPESSTLDKATLGRYIRMRIKSVQACYEEELKRNPYLKGKIVVRFLIMTTGKVSEVGVDQNTMGDEAVASCIVNTIRRWSFPLKPEYDSPVSFPFVFSPGG